MGRQLTRQTEEGLAMKLGPDIRHVSKGLIAGMWMFGQTTSLMLDTFWPQHPDGWDAVYADAFAALPDLE
jgi:hypothetical protein